MPKPQPERSTFLTVPLLLVVLALLTPWACSTPSPSAPATTTEDNGSTARQAAAHDGFTEILASRDGGFLARDPVKEKSLLYMSGTHYAMGFQMGYLSAREVAIMVHDYCNEMLFEMVDLPISSGDLGEAWKSIRSWLTDLTMESVHYVPTTFLEEMQGIADGYAAARLEGKPGTDRAVSFEDVFLLNQAMDVLSSLTYHVLGRAIMACNQFAAWGDMTEDALLFHGRDFQFYNAGVYQDVALMAVYHPRDATGALRGNPFTTITAPGFVGLATGLNGEGVGMGLDVVHAWPAGAGDPGLGGLLLIRLVMEQAATLEEAVDIVAGTERGCPWLYLISDSRNSKAVVLEAIQSDPLSPWMEKRYGKNLETAEEILGQPLQPLVPERGVCVRAADYIMDPSVRGKGLPPPDSASPSNDNGRLKDNATWYNYNFPDPIEERPDMIVVTNHFLTPGMRPYQWAPLVALVWESYWPATEWRYETQTQLLLDQQKQGPIDWESAWAAADFLNPARPKGTFFHGQDTTQQVRGHIALMDGAHLKFRALYGYYDDSWVEISLGDY